MSVTVVKDKAVTVITMATDSQSLSPPLCQILKMLCCSQMCCSVNKGLMQSDVTAALGTIQIMVGLFNIGLGPGRTSLYPGDLTSMGAAYWLGGVFIAAGIMTLLAGRIPSLGLVRFTTFVNIVGSLFAIIAIVLYAKDLAEDPAMKMCDWRSYFALHYDDDNCRRVAVFFQSLLMAMDITLIIMAVLQLCVCISVAALSVKAVAVARRKEEENGKAVEDEQPQLKEVPLIGSADENQFN